MDVISEFVVVLLKFECQQDLTEDVRKEIGVQPKLHLDCDLAFQQGFGLSARWAWLRRRLFAGRCLGVFRLVQPSLFQDYTRDFDLLSCGRRSVLCGIYIP